MIHSKIILDFTIISMVGLTSNEHINSHVKSLPVSPA